MDKAKILVTGSNGQLGKELQVMSKLYPEFDFIFLSRVEFPIHNAELVETTFSSIQPGYCINCAAYTAVDKAESDSDQAFLINGDSPGILAEACNKFEVKFIHISTDYVFNGDADQPYKEGDDLDPVNTYGASKLKGEELVIARNKQSIIIRTSWVYSEFGNNFVKTMLRLMKERPSLGVVNDQFGSPTYAADLANAMLQIINSNQWQPGVFHYSNEGIITWYEFAKAIKELTDSPCIIHPIATTEFPTPAKRPRFSGFDKNKIKLSYRLTIPEWKSSLHTCLNKLNNPLGNDINPT